MEDCEIYGLKHTLYIWYATDHFLVGDIWFKCRFCTTVVKVDRMYFYLALQTPRKEEPWR